MKFNSQHLSRLNKNIDDLIKAVRGFIDLAHRGELIIDAKGKKSISKLLKKIDALNDELMAYDNGARFVIDAFSQLKMETIRFNTVVDKTEKTIDKAIYKYRDIYEGIQESGHQALTMLGQIQKLYRRLSERECYDLDLLDEIFTSNRHS